MARRSSRFIRPPARTKQWIGNGVARTTIVGGAKTLVASLSAGAFLLRPFTILRTRLLICWFTDQEAADEGPFGEYGQIVVTDTAAAIGVTAVPDPSSISGDSEAAWHVHQGVWTQFLNVGAGNDAAAVSSPTNWTIDSKSMRKVGPDDNVVDMFTEDAGIGGFFTILGRQLIQLH